MSKLKKIKNVLEIINAVLSIITICYCIATWRKAGEEEIPDVEVIP